MPLSQSSVIPESLRPEPMHVEFDELDPIGPGLVTRRGRYTNAIGQTFALTAIAQERDVEVLDDFTRDFYAWFQAVPFDEVPNDLRPSRAAMVALAFMNCAAAEESEERLVGFDVDLDDAPGLARGTEVVVFGQIGDESQLEADL